nr:hypothetical protein [uncultured Cupriavidus sp.]
MLDEGTSPMCSYSINGPPGCTTLALFQEDHETKEFIVFFSLAHIKHLELGIHKVVLYELCRKARNYGFWNVDVRFSVHAASFFEGLGLYRRPNLREIAGLQRHGMTRAWARHLQSPVLPDSLPVSMSYSMHGSSIDVMQRLATERERWTLTGR